ncbi:MAG: hypothetical protein ABH878_07900 [bacterium]
MAIFMTNNLKALSAAAAIFLINVPFGYWRRGERRFSLPWFLAVHLPVPLSIGFRLILHLGLRLYLLPLWAGSFCAGQLVGGKLRTFRQKR